MTIDPLHFARLLRPLARRGDPAIAALVLAAAAAGPLFAQDGTWISDASGVWSNAANWSSNPSIPNGIDQTATLGPLGTLHTITVDTPVTLGALIFDSAPGIAVARTNPNALTFSVSSGSAHITVEAASGTGANSISVPLTLSSPLTIANNNAAVLSGGALFPRALTVSGMLSGSADVTVAGSGEVILTGFNSGWTGALEVASGTLTAAGSSALGYTSSAATVDPGGVLAIQDGINLNTKPIDLAGGVLAGKSTSLSPGNYGGTLTVSADSSLAAIGNGTVQGGLLFTGAIDGPANLTVTSGNFTSTRANLLSGRLILAGGSFTIGAGGSFLDASRVDLNAGLLTLSRPAGSDPASASLAPHAVRLAGGTVALDADLDPAAFLEAGSTGGQIAVNSGSFTAGGTNVLDFSAMPGGAAIALGTTTGGTLSPGLVLKADSDTHTLHLGIPGSSALLTVAATLSDSNGTTGLTIEPGSNVELDAANSYSGATNLYGTLTLGNASALGAGTGADSDGTTVYPGGLLATASGVTLSNEKITAAGGTLNVSTSGPVNVSAPSSLQGTYNGAIGGAGAISVAGSTTFGAANSFTGALLVVPGANLTVTGDPALGNSAAPVNVQGTLTLNTGDPAEVIGRAVNLAGGRLSGMAALTQALTYSGSVFLGGGSSQLTLPGISGGGALSLGGAMAGTSTTGNVVVTGGVSVQGDLIEPGGSFVFAGYTGVSGNTTLTNGTAWFTGSAEFGGTFVSAGLTSGGVSNGTFDGPVSIGGKSFQFSGTTLFRSDVDFGAPGQTITIQGPATIQGQLTQGAGNLVLNADVSVGRLLMNSGTLTTGSGVTLTAIDEIDVSGGTIQGALAGPIVKTGFGAATAIDIGSGAAAPIAVNQGTLIADVYGDPPGAAPLGGPGNVVTVGPTDAVLALFNGASPPPVAGAIRLNNATGFLFTGAIIRTGPTGNFVLSGDVDLGSDRSILGASFDNSGPDPMALEIDGAVSGGGLTTNGIVTLTNAHNTYTGPTVITMAPVIPAPGFNSGPNYNYNGITDATLQARLTLLNGGRIATSSSISIERGASLVVDNRGASVTSDAVADSIPITLDGGNLEQWSTPANPGAESFGPVHAAVGASAISLFATTTGPVGSVTLASLSRDAGTMVDFIVTNPVQYGGGSTGKVFITTAPAVSNGIIGGWAIGGSVASPMFVTYGPDGVVPITTYQTQLTAAAATDNVFLQQTQGTRSLTGDLTVNSLTVDLFVDTTIDLQSHTLTLASGGYLVRGQPHHAIMSGGVLTAGAPGAGGELFVHAVDGAAEIDANITDNAGGQVSLVKSGRFGLDLGGTNTYSGPTYADAGYLDINSAGALPANNTLLVNGGGVNFALADSSATFALKDLELRQNGLAYGTVGGAAVNADAYVMESGTLHLRLTGSGAMQKNTEGLLFMAAQTGEYSGTIDVNQGTLAAWLTDTPLGTGLVRVHAGANLLSQVLTLSNPIELAGDLSTSPPLLGVPVNFNGPVTATGPATITTVDTLNYIQASTAPYFNETLVFNNAVTVQSGASLTVRGGGTVQFNGGVTNHGTLVLTGAATVKGALINTGLLRITQGTAAASAGMTLSNTGTVAVDGGTLLLAAGDGAASSGTLEVGAAGTVEFGADYDFSQDGEEVLTGDGTLIVDAGAMLTLPVDVDFTGTVEVNGTLMLALPRDGGGGADLLPRFAVVAGTGSAAPEPGSLALLAAGSVMLAARRRRRRL
ncbi:MAG TPA: PEP-CTERM sorting domain-containing protein [Phycisphaerae bacterium]|nr:PEP-CTERM sorting domain-containing protein [Phycisphaerae bacterium]